MKTKSVFYTVAPIICILVLFFMSNCSDNHNQLSGLVISDDIVDELYLGDEWVRGVQVGEEHNYMLPNGELLLGNQSYPAISYSGYRKSTRGDSLPNKDEYCPTVDELKEDMRILSAMGIKLLRTYDTQLYQHATRLLQAIDELKQQDSGFEMYVMLGAWIQAAGSYTEDVDHTKEDKATNKAEMDKAIELAARYPEIVKIIAVGNEAMVHWQAHWVAPDVILKWIRYAKEAKHTGVNGHLLPKKVLLTSSDNFATWGAQEEYRNDTLLELIREVDFISLHTYPFHDTHYNSGFWKTAPEDTSKSMNEKVKIAMTSAFSYAVNQYTMVQDYLKEHNIEKPVHMGETGWATVDDHLYHAEGSRAVDEIKMKMYYDAIYQWCFNNNISCFYFEAFNEPWKGGEKGSESHFGLFTVEGRAKYALWDRVEMGIFRGLTRGGNPITKTYNGDVDALYQDLLPPPVK